MQRQSIELLIFRGAGGRQPFVDWFDGLRDRVAEAAVMRRLDRLHRAMPATADLSVVGWRSCG